MNQEPTLTEEERKRLDRQRFIGVETQKRSFTSYLGYSPSESSSPLPMESIPNSPKISSLPVSMSPSTTTPLSLKKTSNPTSSSQKMTLAKKEVKPSSKN